MQRLARLAVLGAGSGDEVRQRAWAEAAEGDGATRRGGRLAVPQGGGTQHNAEDSNVAKTHLMRKCQT